MRHAHDMNQREDRMDDERKPRDSEESEVEPEPTNKPRFGS